MHGTCRKIALYVMHHTANMDHQTVNLFELRRARQLRIIQFRYAKLLGSFCLIFAVAASLVEVRALPPDYQKRITGNNKQLENRLNEANSKLKQYGLNVNDVVTAGQYGNQQLRQVTQKMLQNAPPEAQKQFNTIQSQISTNIPRMVPQSQPPASFPLPVFRGTGTKYSTVQLPSSVSMPSQAQTYSLSIQTQDSFKKVSNWYRSQLPSGEWTLKESTSNIRGRSTASFQGSKGNLHGSIRISGNDTQSLISITAYTATFSSSTPSSTYPPKQ